MDCAKHRFLALIKNRMVQVYQAAQNTQYLIHADNGFPKIRREKYIVQLRPVGRKLTAGSVPVRLLKVAVR